MAGLAFGRKRVQGWILWGLFVGVRLWSLVGGVSILVASEEHVGFNKSFAARPR